LVLRYFRRIQNLPFDLLQCSERLKLNPVMPIKQARDSCAQCWSQRGFLRRAHPNMQPVHGLAVKPLTF
jgi:hypothetical protein